MGKKAESPPENIDRWHPAASIFPMLPDDKLAELADDIEKNGQREAILMLDGMVLDGRNRMAACRLKGIQPVTKVLTDIEDPVAYVLSLNLHRRHLNQSQASMCAARARELYEQQAKERQKRKPADSVVENLPQQNEGQKARDAAGKAFGVSGKTVDYATKVIEQGIPELAQAVDEGRIAVSAAAVLASEPEEVQRAELSNPKRKRNYSKKKGGGKDKEQQQEASKPTGKHNESEVFAIGTADVAITQLKSIPEKNEFRDAAFSRVQKWINSQMKGAKK